METDVAVAIPYDEKEIQNTVSFYIRRILKYSFKLTITSLVLAVIGIFFFVVNQYFVSVLCLGIILELWLLIIPRAIRSYQRYYAIVGTRIFRFSREQVSIEGEWSQSLCRWALYEKAYEIPTAFLLIDRNRFPTVVPKNHLAGENDIVKLREIIASQIPSFRSYL